MLGDAPFETSLRTPSDDLRSMATICDNLRFGAIRRIARMSMEYVMEVCNQWEMIRIVATITYVTMRTFTIVLRNNSK